MFVPEPSSEKLKLDAVSIVQVQPNSIINVLSLVGSNSNAMYWWSLKLGLYVWPNSFWLSCILILRHKK